MALLVGALLAGCHNMGDFSASDAITIARTGSFELEMSPEEALGWTSKIERCRRAAALSDGDSVYLRQIPTLQCREAFGKKPRVAGQHSSSVAVKGPGALLFGRG